MNDFPPRRSPFLLIIVVRKTFPRQRKTPVINFLVFYSIHAECLFISELSE